MARGKKDFLVKQPWEVPLGLLSLHDMHSLALRHETFHAAQPKTQLSECHDTFHTEQVVFAAWAAPGFVASTAQQLGCSQSIY